MALNITTRDRQTVHYIGAPVSARFSEFGAPDATPAAHGEVKTWAAANGHRLDVLEDDNGGLWTGHAEHFLTDPTEEPDPSKWVTDLLFKTL